MSPTTTSAVDRIVAATLYEGYILYPYRPSSVKNQVRWTFGGVHPRAYSEASGGSEAWTAQTECLLRPSASARVEVQVEVQVRFLQLVTRTVARLVRPVAVFDASAMPALEPVAELTVAGVTHRSWEEAVERRLDGGTHAVHSLFDRDVGIALATADQQDVEPLRDESGLVCGALLRDREPLAAELTVSAERVDGGLARLRVVVRNTSDFVAGGSGDRERALRRSLISTHAVLVATGATWLSLADPPEDARLAAEACRNVGLWPVLIGEPGAADTVLASPIILDDHPEVAQESAGELFDSTEIDEILSLRILTLTDQEKAEMRSADERARAMLERTESLSRDDLMRLHGTIRELRPTRGESP
jgi:hypothetical protein